MSSTIEFNILPDCLRSRQLGQRGAGRIQVQLHGASTDICVRLARFRRSHQPGRMGLCGLLSTIINKLRMQCCVILQLPKSNELSLCSTLQLLFSFPLHCYFQITKMKIKH